MTVTLASPRVFGSGIRRREDPRLISGAARYTDDITLPGMLHAAILRSPHAHARIAGIETARAKSAPGVVAVFTSEDIDSSGAAGLPCGWLVTDVHGQPMKEPKHPILAAGKVRHVGDPVAAVVAETPAQAQDAAEHMRVAYEPLPCVTDLVEAARPGARAVWPDLAPDNECFHFRLGDFAAVEAAFARAAHVV